MKHTTKKPAARPLLNLSNPFGKAKAVQTLGTFAYPLQPSKESATEKALRLSQDIVHKAQVAYHDVDPNNASAVRIKRKAMDTAELHHHKLWIAHHKEVMAKEK